MKRVLWFVVVVGVCFLVAGGVLSQSARSAESTSAEAAVEVFATNIVTMFETCSVDNAGERLARCEDVGRTTSIGLLVSELDNARSAAEGRRFASMLLSGIGASVVAAGVVLLIEQRTGSRSSA